MAGGVPNLSAQHREVSRGTILGMGGDKLNLYFFESGKKGLKVMDEGDLTGRRIYGEHEKAFYSRQCEAGVNGGFFTRENNPLGLVVQSGRRIHTVESGSFIVSGVLYDNGRSVGLVRSRDYLKWPRERQAEVKEALQGGPFLVEKGKKIGGLDREKPAMRTFVATDGKGRWCLGVSSALTLDELAGWLSAPGALGDFTVRDALNLDGGSSSLFWTRAGGSVIAPIKQVRNYLGVAPRQSGAK